MQNKFKFACAAVAMATTLGLIADAPRAKQDADFLQNPPKSIPAPRADTMKGGELLVRLSARSYVEFKISNFIKANEAEAAKLLAGKPDHGVLLRVPMYATSPTTSPSTATPGTPFYEGGVTTAPGEAFLEAQDKPVRTPQQPDAPLTGDTFWVWFSLQEGKITSSSLSLVSMKHEVLVAQAEREKNAQEALAAKNSSSPSAPQPHASNG